MEHNYRISHRIGESSFELESTDKAWIDAKEKEYLSLLSEKPAKQVKSLIKEIPGDEKKESLSPNLTINEFYRRVLKSSKVTSRPDMAVFFVYYLSEIAKLGSIKSSDVSQCFADISYPGYNKLNIADILGKAKRKALLNNVNSQWTLTMSGEDYVLNFITNPEK